VIWAWARLGLFGPGLGRPKASSRAWHITTPDVAHRVCDEDVSLANVPREIQNEGLMRAILLELALYKLWTLLASRLDIDGLLDKKDSSSRRFEWVWTLPIFV